MASYSVEMVGEEAKVRYFQKLKDIGMDNCPYEIPADAWVDDPTTWPDLEYPEVYEYLINTPGVFTKEAMQNRKSLEAHNQFVSGWVRTVYLYKNMKMPFTLMKAEVTPSQRLNEKPHNPWVAVNNKSK